MKKNKKKKRRPSVVKLIHIGRRFYVESGSMMSSLYTESWERSNLGQVELDLEAGKRISIRPATKGELKLAERVLDDYKVGKELEDIKY